MDKFYVQNGEYKEFLIAPDADDAARDVIAGMLTEEMPLCPVTFVSNAGYMDDMNKYGLPHMIDDTVRAFTTRSLIMVIHEMMETDDCKSLLEDVVVGLHEFEQTVPEIQAVIELIETP